MPRGDFTIVQSVCLYASSVEAAGQTALEGTHILLSVAYKASLTFSSLRFHARELQGLETSRTCDAHFWRNQALICGCTTS